MYNGNPAPDNPEPEFNLSFYCYRSNCKLLYAICYMVSNISMQKVAEKTENYRNILKTLRIAALKTFLNKFC